MEVKPPFLVSYSITTKCNLSCKHCYSEATGEAAPDELYTEEALKLVDELANWGIGLFVIDGGEPLCRDDFLEIVSYASSKGIMTGVGSNGTLIDRGMAQKMLEAGVQSVSISIDGVDAETHDSFRGKSGAFDQAMAGASACKAVGLPFQFNMVIRKATLSQIPEMLDLAVRGGSNAAEFFDLVEAGRAKELCQGEVLEPGERKAIMEWLAQAQVDCPILIRVPACPMYPLVLKQRQVRPRHFPAEALRRIPYYNRGCAAGMPFGYLVVRANGEVNPCMLLQIEIGNVRAKSIVKIWQESEILAQLRSRELLQGRCGECEYKLECAGCRGRAYERSGDMLAPDTGCWL